MSKPHKRSHEDPKATDPHGVNAQATASSAASASADHDDETRRPSARILAAIIAVLALVTLIALAPGGSTDSPNGEDFSTGDYRLNIVAYAVPKAGFDKIIPAFRGTEEGANVGFAESYGASGDQSRKVVRRVPTDVVNFSVEPDITRLVKAGLVDDNWRENIPGDASGKAVPFGSVVSFVTRKGNPKNIHTWDDLLRDGVEVISPNPASSGSAKWNILAPYAYWFFQALDKQDGARQGDEQGSAKAGSEQGGKDYVAAHEFATEKVRQLVSTAFKVRPKSGREATSAFEQGQGDVLLSYENEAIMLDRTSHGSYDYLNPDATFRIENPVAVVNTSENLAQATAFRDFLFTEQAQRIWASEGFRPGADLFAGNADGAVIDSLPAEQRDRFRPVRTVHSIDELAEALAALAEQSPELADKHQLLKDGKPKSGWAMVDAFLFNRAQPGDGTVDGVISTIYKEA